MSYSVSNDQEPILSECFMALFNRIVAEGSIMMADGALLARVEGETRVGHKYPLICVKTDIRPKGLEMVRSLTLLENFCAVSCDNDIQELGILKSGVGQLRFPRKSFDVAIFARMADNTVHPAGRLNEESVMAYLATASSVLDRARERERMNDQRRAAMLKLDK